MLIRLAVSGLLCGLVFGSNPVILYSNCAQSEKLGAVAPETELHVVSSITGEDGICYRVTGQVKGQPLTGAIFDSSHPAAAAYRAAIEKTVTPPPPPPQAAAEEQAAPVDRPASFENFRGTNFNDGEPIELAKLESRVILVHIWKSTDDRGAQQDAQQLAELRQKFGAQGLDVVAITPEKNQTKVRDFNDRTGADWPLVQDRSGLSEKYGVRGASEIFVLDASRNIAGAAVRGAELDELVGKQFVKLP